MGTVDLLETFAAVVAGVESDEAPETFYNRLCEATCALANLDRAVIFSYDEARGRVRAMGAHGVDLGRFADADVNVETAPIARLSLAADAVVEAGADDKEAAVPPEYADLVEHTRLVCAPMVAGGRWLGVILCNRRDGEARLSADERETLWTLAKVTALAMQARVATSAMEQARALQHRVDLARDVHDEVIQRLFGVSLALASGEALTEEAQRRAGAEVQEALAELRLLLGRPLERARKPEMSLPDEAKRLGVEIEGEAPVPEGCEGLAVSVLAEAAANARKHAEPSRIRARVDHADGVWSMEVLNDGVGGPPKAPPGMGLRLAALEALQAGGLVEFGPAGKGEWRVRLALPRD